MDRSTGTGRGNDDDSADPASNGPISKPESTSSSENGEKDNKDPYIQAQVLCYQSLIERGELVGNDLSQYSDPFSEVFGHGIFDSSGIYEVDLATKFAKLPEGAQSSYTKAEAAMTNYLVKKGKVKDLADFISQGYDKALKIFFCGDLETIKALQAGHPSKIAQAEEAAVIQADPQIMN